VSLNRPVKVSDSVSDNVNDSVNLKLTIRVPTNARSFSYQFKFYSAEFPEYLCQKLHLDLSLGSVLRSEAAAADCLAHNFVRRYGPALSR
jgi:hypothetical protein